MRLKSIQLSKNIVDKFGLSEFTSNKFESVIALVGKNGSGKSRYLKAIEEYILDCDVTTDFEAKFNFVPNELLEIRNEFKQNPTRFQIVKEFELATIFQHENPKNQAANERLSRAAARMNSVSADIRSKFQKNNQMVSKEIQKRLKLITHDDLRSLKGSFEGSGKVSFQDILDSTAENADLNEFTLIAESSLTYLKRLPHKLAYDEIDSRGDEKKLKARVSFQRFKLIHDLIEEFLGKKLEWHSKTANVSEHDDHVNIQTTGFWTINGKEFDYNKFSEGEKVLFTYAILLFLLNLNPRIRFRESIIIIDEPEINLHPKAQIQLIKSLENLVGEKGQILIATHSLSIVSNLEYGSIFLVRDNELITPSSSVPFNAVDDLMGFEEHYNKLVEFLVSTPAWAMTNFMGQCFEDPEVFNSASKNDPQLEVFQKILLEKTDISLLDFGSGKGRLLSRIKENGDSWNRISKYDCFDLDKKFNELILEKGANSIINNLKEIPNNAYDLILLVNVLHEIHIKDWSESLIKIKRALKPSGFLAVIEDIELPIGELPNEIGFILLGKKEMEILLGKKIRFLSPSVEKYKNRIVCGVVGYQDLNSVTEIKIKSALEELNKNSLDSIVSYRNQKDKNVSLGRLYGLKANLYVNSKLALDFFSNN